MGAVGGCLVKGEREKERDGEGERTYSARRQLRARRSQCSRHRSEEGECIVEHIEI